MIILRQVMVACIDLAFVLASVLSSGKNLKFDKVKIFYANRLLTAD